ncbi:DUF2232 domain-containing protein [Halobacteriovorax sp. RT-1-4]|uniref:DUF2232 domain-containing protein n=1 Tax=unclassified Halobacteriovorax TaxID=2639665 RepID=UPI00399AFFD5
MNDKKPNTFTLISKDNFTIGKLLFLCVVSLILSVAYPLGVFSPLPVAFAFLIYGNLKTLVTFGVTIVLCFVAAQSNDNFLILANSAYVLFYAVIIGYLSAATILRNEDPVKGLLKRGFILLLVIFGLLGTIEVIFPSTISTTITTSVNEGLSQLKNSPDYKELIARGGEVAATYQSVFENPEDIIKRIYQWGFSVIFVSTFFILWLTVFMLLRNAKLWKMLHGYKFGLKHFVRFQVPEYFALIVVIGLALFLGGEYIGGEIVEVIGLNILLCLGIFYFFQGMGVYLDFLKYIKVTGFVRSILAIMTIFFAHRFIAIVGLLDYWVNFRRFFKNNKEI